MINVTIIIVIIHEMFQEEKVLKFLSRIAHSVFYIMSM